MICDYDDGTSSGYVESPGATPSLDPYPPEARMIINNGAFVTDRLEVHLTFNPLGGPQPGRAGYLRRHPGCPAQQHAGLFRRGLAAFRAGPALDARSDLPRQPDPCLCPFSRFVRQRVGRCGSRFDTRRAADLPAHDPQVSDNSSTYKGLSKKYYLSLLNMTNPEFNIRALEACQPIPLPPSLKGRGKIKRVWEVVRCFAPHNLPNPLAPRPWGRGGGGG